MAWRMKSFNILGVHGKTQFLEGGKREEGGGGVTKNQYSI